jgi:MFS family permease
MRDWLRWAVRDISEYNNRWWIVVASMIGLSVGQGPIIQFCFAIFLKPMAEDLGLSRGALSLSLLLSNLMSAGATPIVGMLIDRYGNRQVMLPGSIAFAIAVALLSMLRASPIISFYLLFGLAGLSAAVQSASVYATLVCKWFDRGRGFALGLATAGIGLGVLIVPQLADLAIRAWGWRMAYLFLSGAVIVCASLPIAIVVREPVSATGVTVRMDPPGLTFSEAIQRSRRFWVLALAFFVGGMSIQGTLVHLVALLTDRGVDPYVAVTAFSSIGIALIIARVGCGYCLDRLEGPSVAMTAFIVPTVGIGLLASGLTGPFPFLGVLMCGLGIGALTALQPFFASRYFGLKSIGAISGTFFAAFLAGAGLGPFIGGICFDIWHSYAPVLGAFAIALGLMSTLFIPFGSYPFVSR